MAFVVMLFIFILGSFLGFSMGVITRFDWQAFWDYKRETQKMIEEKGNKTLNENN